MTQWVAWKRCWGVVQRVGWEFRVCVSSLLYIHVYILMYLVYVCTYVRAQNKPFAYVDVYVYV